MAAQVLLVAALHYDDLGGRLRIIHSSGHYDVPPVECPLSDRVRLGFLHVVGIVAHDAVASLASSANPNAKAMMTFGLTCQYDPPTPSIPQTVIQFSPLVL
jgi:hypothetical protein